MKINGPGISCNGYLANSMTMSADGRYIAYVASNPFPAPLVRELFVFDSLTQASRPVSEFNSSLGGSGKSHPAISDDGRTLAFVMDSNDVAVVDLASGALHFVTTVDGARPNGPAARISTSSNGQFVLFESMASNLVAGDNNARMDLFLHDVASGSTTRLSDSERGYWPYDGLAAKISGDGGTVVFQDRGQVIARSVASGTDTVVSAASAITSSFDVSADGRYVAFTTLEPGGNVIVANAYRKDLHTGDVVRIEPPSSGASAAAMSYDAEISNDGRYVSFFQIDAYRREYLDFFRFDTLTSEVIKARTWPGHYVLAESMLSNDGAHFASVTVIVGIADVTYHIQTARLLADGAFAPNGGDDFISGEPASIDTLAYLGSRSNFIISARSSTYWTVTGEGVDGLLDVDRLRFSDGNVALDINGAAGQAYRLYQAAFDRAPDQAGAGFWINALDKGQSLLQVASAFVASNEFKQVFGAASSNEQIVNLLYQNILHRPGDSAGVQFWTSILNDSRATLPEVLIGFSESGENTAALVGVMQAGIPYLPYS